MTKKQMINKLASGPVQAFMVGGVAVEDWPAIVAEKTQWGWTVNASGNLTCGTTFILCPKLNRVRTGRMVFKSARYDFVWDDKSSSGETARLELTETGLSLTMFNGAKIEYTPCEEASK